MGESENHTANIQPVAKCDQLSNTIQIEGRILSIRNTQVMIDRDLSELYGVETKRLNEQVKRNIERFPERFRFQLTEEETNELVINCDRFKTLKHSSVCPYVFTEQGVAMLSSVLRSETAVSVSIQIMDAFVAMRRFLVSNAQVFQRLEAIEFHQLELQHHQKEADKRIDEIFQKFEDKVSANQGIFYDGQVFDAYVFVSDLIKKAHNSIVLIDNYVDETVLTMLDKRESGVAATIYTQQISRQLQLDINRHNA